MEQKLRALIKEAMLEKNKNKQVTYKNILEEFEKLPEQTKQVCELFYIDNLTVSQIKEALNIPTGTIKSLLFRTRKKIQKQFKQEL